MSHAIRAAKLVSSTIRANRIAQCTLEEWNELPLCGTQRQLHHCWFRTSVCWSNRLHRINWSSNMRLAFGTGRATAPSPLLKPPPQLESTPINSPSLVVTPTQSPIEDLSFDISIDEEEVALPVPNPEVVRNMTARDFAIGDGEMERQWSRTNRNICHQP